MNQQKKLIIFDMDGVLLDSEPLYMAMNLNFFKELGADVSIEEYHSFIGISATKMWTHLKNKYKLEQTIGALKEQERELKHALLKETKLIATCGIIDLLEYLKLHQYIIAIASSGLRKNIDLILQKLDIGQYFTYVVSGEQVVNGKPDPDIFLLVANHFNRKPEHCVVIEDSTNGIAAAKAANMFCIAYYNPNSGNQNLAKADMIIYDFKDPQLYQLLP